MTRGTLELKYSQILEFLPTMLEKEKERKRLTCDEVKCRMGNQFEVCGAFAMGSWLVLLFCHIQSY